MNPSLRGRAAFVILAAATAACAKPLEIGPTEDWGTPRLTPARTAAQWSDIRVPSVMDAGKTHQASLAVKNTGSAPWPALGPDRTPLRAVRVAYHWYRADGTIYKAGERTNLPKDLAPGESVKLENVTVVAPADSGEYFLAFDLLQEMVRWFDTPSARIAVTVK